MDSGFDFNATLARFKHARASLKDLADADFNATLARFKQDCALFEYLKQNPFQCYLSTI